VKHDDIVRLIEAARDPDPAGILDALVEASGAERGFLVFRVDGAFQVSASRNIDHEEVRAAGEKLSRTLLERALAEGRPLVAGEAETSAIESLTRQKVRAVCVLPLRSCEGAVYLDHRFAADAFARADELADYAAALDRSLQAARAREGYGDLVGASKPMQDLYRILEKVAASPYPVLIQGESGTGKELVARALHRRGPRAGGPFVAANCASLPEHLVDAELFGHARGAFTGAERDRPGLFEQADGGVLFLDEIACLSKDAQESFLRVLETREVRRIGGTKAEKVDVRVVAATNEDLELAEGFRRDLFYRLNVLRVELPPLRDRLEDLPLLVEHLLARIARETGLPPRRITKEALASLASHRWPGNVRELENALRRAASLSESDFLGLDDFAFLRARAPSPASPEGIASIDDHIRATLLQWGDRLDLAEIADRLGLSRKTLWEKKKKLGL
jgi:DNA-binding NtrC family response regulator